jgi:Uma2 family endonuclease
MVSMGEPLAKPYLSPAEYLTFERSSLERRHEYHEGEVFAMTGGSFAHSLLIGNLTAALHARAAERGCFVCPSDMRLKVEGANAYLYPDVTVVCGEPQFDDSARDSLLNPLVIVEVLSDSTESYDRGDKFGLYRAIPSLADYLLVSQKRAQVEHFHRADDDTWTLTVVGPGSALTLPSVGCELAVDDLYRQVPLQEGVEGDDGTAGAPPGPGSSPPGG